MNNAASPEVNPITLQKKENLMKNVTLFACLLVMTLGATAQNSHSTNPVAIPPNARGGERPNAVGGVTTVHVPQASEAAVKPAPNGGPQGPPVAKVPPNAVQVGNTAKK
jgi:hypothetical protein